MEAVLAAVLGYALLAALVAGGAMVLMRWLTIDVISASVLSTAIVLGLGALYFGIAMYLGAG
ncbi:MAG: hypothetical protein AB7V13_04660 [Pseudorhodoplanes sp.]|uniref:hypothetical protein n=1 Tax=Pseudorhodoplanes sp. TaxID=1934341 RepID=UPI003D0FEE30